ncbi:hypothetical protein JYB62_14285 [Algoriphagus lutimaris]|uniref:hypothetical protein n=1 Tax=Algoriphagus lutimaris TaxID=613197 RepID=UPI00196A3BDA|nr:hypothetical protein [Algoriphagus lutimaris]MBN3521175.1 hypothetical protein [Algoriphagus lutimaris]
MKNARAFFLFTILLGLFSCKEDKDILPLSPLEGIWQRAVYNSDQKVFFIFQYIFQKDGTLEKSILIRESETTTILGYYSNAIGTYELRGESYTENITKMYELKLDAYLLYVPKENLQETEVTGTYPITGSMIFSSNNRSFDLVYPCNDTPNGRVNSCVGALTYRRVD